MTLSDREKTIINLTSAYLRSNKDKEFIKKSLIWSQRDPLEREIKMEIFSEVMDFIEEQKI